MKKNRKLLTGVILFSLLSISIFSIGDALAAAGDDTTFQSYTGHSLSEESFSMIYDVIGDEMVTDYSPGEYSGALDEGSTDSRVLRDANYYTAYTNLGQVQTLYMANQNITLDANNATWYGCAPYQLMINHFRTGGNQEVFVINTFMGLLAYQENPGEVNGVPDADEEMYMGWTAYSELFKHYFNEGLERSSIPTENLFDSSVVATGTPIQMTKEIDGDKNVFTYGMSYENIFVVWQNIDYEEGMNETDSMNSATVVNQVSAVCLLDSLNFTFMMTGENSTSGYTNVTTDTLYEIGEISNLWIVGDSQGVADYFDGHHYEYILPDSSKDIALYNESINIQNRLQGNTSTPGFSLAIANYLDMVVMGQNAPQLTINDQDGSEIDPETQDENVTKTDLNLNIRNRAVKAFEMSTEGKDSYILNGDSENPEQAITKLLRNTKIKSPISSNLYWQIKGFLVKIFQKISPDFTNENALKLIYNEGSMVYLTCFPEWNGQSIVNDPTFTVFGGSGTSFGWQITTWQILLIVGLSAAAVVVVVVQKRKRK